MHYKRIGQLRVDRDVKQKALAEYLNIKQSTYSDYENGKINVPTDALIKLAEFYHVSLDYLVDSEQKQKSAAVKPGRYRHFKGNEYRVLFTARHSETEEAMVVYQPLYGAGGYWVRPAAMWSEQVEREDYSGPRFTYVGD